MRLFKTGLISIIIISTLLFSVNNILFNNSTHPQDHLFQSYNLDFSNNSIILSVKALQNVFLSVTIIRNQVVSTFQSNNPSQNPKIQLSYPNESYLLSASLSTERNSTIQEKFLVNKSIFQPDHLLISKYAKLTTDNNTEFFFKTNMELIEDLSSVKFLNSTNSKNFYQYTHIISKNTTFSFVDNYYRHFTELLTPLTPVSPIHVPIKPPIIVLNGTYSNNPTKAKLLLNSSISNKQFIANETIISSATLLNSSLKSNTTLIENSSILKSSICSNVSLDSSTLYLYNSSLKTLSLHIDNATLLNSTIIANTTIITNSIINNSLILSNAVKYQNVTFINNTTSINASEGKLFNYSVNYIVKNSNSVIVNISTNELSNVTVYLMNNL